MSKRRRTLRDIEKDTMRIVTNELRGFGPGMEARTVAARNGGDLIHIPRDVFDRLQVLGLEWLGKSGSER